MKNIIFCLIIVSNFITSVFAQTGAIRGRVFDNVTKTPIAFANVYVLVNNKPIATQTDSLGHFKLNDLSPGTYTLNVSFIGYYEDSIQNIKVESNKIIFLRDIFLVSRSKELLSLVDIWYKDDLINDENYERLRSSELENLSERRNITQIINVITPGVYVNNDGSQIHFKGSRNGGIVYYVDGIKSRNNNIGIPTMAISDFTVYTGGIPARYGDFDGVVVTIETKGYIDLQDISGDENYIY